MHAQLQSIGSTNIELPEVNENTANVFTVNKIPARKINRFFWINLPGNGKTIMIITENIINVINEHVNSQKVNIIYQASSSYNDC